MKHPIALNKERRASISAVAAMRRSKRGTSSTARRKVQARHAARQRRH